MNINIKISKFKNWKVVIIGLSIVLLVTAGCASAEAQTAPAAVSASKPNVVLKMSGSGTATAILAGIAPAFEADTPGYHLKILTGTGTGGGVEGIFAGSLDVAAMGRAPTEEESPQLEFVPLGFGGEVPITHADLNITSLTSEQIAAIFSGKIDNWSEVGGPDLPIIVYVRGDTTPHTQLLRQAVFGNTPFSETAQLMGGMGDMVVAVEGTPGSIGFAQWPAVVSKGINVQAIGVDGVKPNDPAYPAILPFGISYVPDRQADVQPLVDWLLSEQGQVALRESGVIFQ